MIVFKKLHQIVGSHLSCFLLLSFSFRRAFRCFLRCFFYFAFHCGLLSKDVLDLNLFRFFIPTNEYALDAIETRRRIPDHFTLLTNLNASLSRLSNVELVALSVWAVNMLSVTFVI